MVGSVVQQCGRVARLADLITGAGPVKVTVTKPDRIAVERGGTVRAEVHNTDLAEFLDAAPIWLRTLAEAVATIYVEHTPSPSGTSSGTSAGADLRCPECGTAHPCRTRRLLDVRILRTGADSPPPPG